MNESVSRDGGPASGPVVHPTDFSEGARAAYPYGLYLAALLGSEMRSVHVCRPGEPEPDPSRFPVGDQEAMRLASAWLEEVDARRFAGTGGQGTGEGGPGGLGARVRRMPEVRRDVRRGGSPDRELLAYADRIPAAAFVMGTHGRTGLRRLFLGSVAERVIRRSPVPVLTVRQGIEGWGESGLHRILVAADLSPTMDRALRWAGAVAAGSEADLEAVHVVETPAGAAPSGKRQRIRAAYGESGAPEVELKVTVVAGDPATRIRATAREDGADLVVTATHGRSGPARLVLGSVTEAVVRRSPCPVLTVPPQDR